jgi:transposase
MNIKYIVELTEEERVCLLELTSKGKGKARMIKRANILLMADHRQNDEEQIAELLSVGSSTIYRTKRDFVEYGLEVALEEGKRLGQPRKLDANREALLVSIACSKPPEGRCQWTLSLLTDELIALTEGEPVSRETVRRRLKDNALKPWQKKMWCISSMNADYVAQMEHVLDIYAEAPDSKRPVVNFDEAMKQLVSDISEPSPVKSGQPAKIDYEYKRAGMANIFMFFDRHRGWRKAKVTQCKKSPDFAECMRDLVDTHYPDAEVVRVVMDNYCTHRPASLYKAFPPEEARRILRRLEFNYTPKHASWLNMVEIEIGNMNQQCLNRRMADRDFLISELAAWESQQNQKKATINWMFNVDGARSKLNRAYEKLIGQN